MRTNPRTPDEQLLEGAGTFWGVEIEIVITEKTVPMRETSIKEPPDADRTAPGFRVRIYQHDWEDDCAECDDCNRCHACGDCTCDHSCDDDACADCSECLTCGECLCG